MRIIVRITLSVCPAPEGPAVIPAVPSSHKTVMAAVLKWVNRGHEKLQWG